MRINFESDFVWVWVDIGFVLKYRFISGGEWIARNLSAIFSRFYFKNVIFFIKISFLKNYERVNAIPAPPAKKSTAKFKMQNKIQCRWENLKAVNHPKGFNSEIVNR